MSSYPTRIIRVYEKSRNDKLDKNKLFETILSTAHMNYELQYFENLEEGCFDLKINTKNGSGELGLEFSLFDIWEIYGDERNTIKHQNKSIITEESVEFYFFGFDEIRIEGNQSKLDKFYKDISNSAFLDRKVESESIRTIDVNGIYNSSCYYDLGEYDSKVKNIKDQIRKMTKDEFIEPQGKAAVVYDVLTNGFKIHKLNQVLERIDYDCSDGKVYPNLSSIKFMWKGRIVNQIIRRADRKGWLFQSADWWDNCLNPEWLEFKKKTEANKG